MERLTYRDDKYRARLTQYGKHIYCSTQATADCICKLEEALQCHIPRVMTLEEVDKASVAWMETAIYGECLPALIITVYSDDTVGIVTADEDGEYYMDAKSYGVDWRCWTSCPTDEQREAVKWECLTGKR